MKLEKIFIYPIKSLGGISLQKTVMKHKGLEHDRRWMLVDENNKFITIREQPKLLKFSIEYLAKGFRIKHGASHLNIPFDISEGSKLKTKIWNDGISVIEGKTEWNNWFSEQLNRACKLVHFPEESERQGSKKWCSPNQQVSLADGYPLLVVGEESLNDLNHKLNKPISVMRFRPNLVFSGGEPYEEFRWSTFKIGNNSFQGLKPCVRCVVTTYDENTLEKGIEPLKTLSKQRVDKNIVFGQHSVGVGGSIIEVGQEITVESYKNAPYDPL